MLVAVLDTPSEAYMSGSGAGFSPAAGMIVSGSPPIGEGTGWETRLETRLSTECARVAWWRGRGSMDDAVLAWDAKCDAAAVFTGARGVKCRAAFVGPRRSSADERPGAETAASVTLAQARGGQPAVNSGGAHNYSFFSQQRSRLIPFSNERTRGGQSAPRARVANAHGPPRP